MKTILDRMQDGFAEVKTEIAEVKTEIAEVKTEIAEVKTEIAEVKTEIAEVKTEIAEVKTEIAEVKTEIAEVRTDIAEMETKIAGAISDIAEMKTDIIGVKRDIHEMKTDSGEMKTKFFKLEAKVGRIDKRAGYLVELRVRRYIEERRGHEWAQHLDVRTLDEIASLLFRRTPNRPLSPYMESDLTMKKNRITNTLAEWCIQSENLASFFEMLHTIYKDSDCNDVDYQDPKNMMALLEHITKLNDENKKPQDDDGEMDSGEEPVLQGAKKLVKMFSLDPKDNLANKKILVREHHGLALSILFASPEISEHRKKLCGKRWAWSSLEFDCRGRIDFVNNSIEFGEIKSSCNRPSRRSAFKQVAFRMIVLEYARQIIMQGKGSDLVPCDVLSGNCDIYYESGNCLLLETNTTNYVVGGKNVKVTINQHILRHVQSFIV